MSRKSRSSPKVSQIGPKYTKTNLPTKTCAVCGLSFSWRKKWQDCWQEVKYCSERCRHRRQTSYPAPETDSD